MIILDVWTKRENTDLLSTTGRHAVRALVVLAQLPEGRYLGAHALAETIDAPPNYLGKILKEFAKMGLVVSQKGLNGGFRLGCSADAIRLHQIIDPVEDLSKWSGCVLGRKGCCETNPCILHRQWKEVSGLYTKLLETTTLADLIEPDCPLAPESRRSDPGPEGSSGGGSGVA